MENDTVGNDTLPLGMDWNPKQHMDESHTNRTEIKWTMNIILIWIWKFQVEI